MKHVIFVFVFLFNLINIIYSLQDYDYPDESLIDVQYNYSSCVLDNGEEGECKSLLECPSVIETFHFEDPVYCESFDDEAVVCCPLIKSSSMVMRRTKFLSPLENLPKPASFDAFECGFSEKYVDIHFKGEKHRSATQPSVQSGRRKKRWVVGGKESDPGEFPWMALVGKIEKDGKMKWICDGVLIHPKWILTAAHCLLDSMGYKVRLGEHNIVSNVEPFQQDFNVTKMIFHPDYKFGINYHDLALAKISSIAKLSDSVMPICLPWKPDLNVVGKTATLAGWGAEMFGGRQSNVLRDVDVTIFANSICDKSYSTLREYRTVWPSGINNNYIICAGGKEGGIDACEGDSGGPLVRKRKDRVVLVGLVSRGFGCGLKDFPGIYVAVRTYLVWICDSILQDYLSSG